MNKNQLAFTQTFARMRMSNSSLKAVKVCAVVSQKDAQMIVSMAKKLLPADVQLLVGMILWPNSRRSVDLRTAAQISRIAVKSGALPVAVFVDETVETMNSICTDIGVSVAQLHGPKSRLHWESTGSTSHLDWIDIRDVSPQGTVSEPTFSPARSPLWSIYDAKGGGTGNPFDWSSFAPPNHPWLLAGGLNPENVAEAIRSLKPTGLDVATGVAYSDKRNKDPIRLHKFLKHVVETYSETRNLI